MAYLNYVDFHLEEYSEENYLVNKLKKIEKDEQKVIENYKHISHKFNLETRCITALLDRLLPKVYTKDCKKLNIRCGGTKKFDGIKGCLGVYEVQIIFDYYTFIRMSNEEKKICAFDTMVSAIRSVIKQENWDAKPFEETFQKIKELNYTNEYIWKTIYRKDRKYSAELFIQHEVEEITFTVRFRDKNNEIISESKILKGMPYDILYEGCLGKFEWIDNETVVLHNKQIEEEKLVAILGIPTNDEDVKDIEDIIMYGYKKINEKIDASLS